MERLSRKSSTSRRRGLRTGHVPGRMVRHRSVRLFTMLGCAVIMLVCHVVPTAAQIDEVRKDSWEKAKTVFPLIVDAAAAGTVRKAYELMTDFKTTLESVQGK